MRARSRLVVLTLLSSFATPLLTAQQGGSGRAPSDTSRNPALAKKIIAENRRLLVQAKVQGKTDGVILIATEMGAVPRVAEAVVGLGGTVRMRFDDVGYLRVVVPLAKFNQIHNRPDVVYALIDAQYYPAELAMPAGPPMKAGAQSLSRDMIAAAADSPDKKKPKLPPEAMTADNPFVPMQDMRVRDFQRAHPTFDGRGVTVGILEGRSIVDVQHPTLQKARTLTGEVVSKIAGIVDPEAFEPREPLRDKVLGSGGPNAFNARDQRIQPTGPLTTAADGTILLDGYRYNAPRAGAWYAGIYSSAPAPSTTPNAPRQPSVAFGILWNDAHNEIWVDTDRDHDFRNETPLTDLNVKFSSGRLKYDSTQAKPMHSRSFAVTFDSAKYTVLLYEGTNSHSTMVASVSTGHNLGGGESNAAGFNARFVIISAGSGIARYIESWVRAARDPRIDLITSSQFAIQFPDAGEGIQEIILARANRIHAKPMMRSAGNAGPNITSAYGAGLTPGFMAIGAAISQGTYKAHFGWTVPRMDNVWAGSSRGPMLNGGFKPDVITPLHHVSASPCSLGPSEAARDRYEYPLCHRLSGGTSSAAPVASGATAALLSAARQTPGVPTDGPHIRWAIRAGARFIDGYQPYEQGRGMLDLTGAWDALTRIGNTPIPEIRVEGPIAHVYNRHLRTPQRGIGLYEREGWTVGDTGTRVLKLTRTTGPKGSVTYGLRWKGNDGTFTAPTTITLPLDKTVNVPIRVSAKEQGIHSASLEIVDRKLDLPIGWAMAAIVAAQPLTESNGYGIQRQITVTWPNANIQFIRVPEGTRTLAITTTVTKGRAALTLHDPTKESESSRSRETEEQLVEGKHGTRVVSTPLPGVWGLIFYQCTSPGSCAAYSDTTKYQTNAELSYTVRALRGDGDGLADGKLAGSVTVAVPTDSTAPFTTGVSFSNKYAGIAQPEVRQELGVYLQKTGRVFPDSADKPLEITVDSGTTSLRVRVTSDVPAGAELHLFDCSGRNCDLYEVRRRDSRVQELIVLSPTTGKWKVMLDGAEAPLAGSAYTLEVIRTGSQFGLTTAGTVERINEGATLRSWAMGWWRGTVKDTTWTPVLVSDLVDSQSYTAWMTKPLSKPMRKPAQPYPVGTVVTRLVVPKRP
jgi:hypothetical protein